MFLSRSDFNEAVLRSCANTEAKEIKHSRMFFILDNGKI
jgi:hypothetical protein